MNLARIELHFASSTLPALAWLCAPDPLLCACRYGPFSFEYERIRCLLLCTFRGLLALFPEIGHIYWSRGKKNGADFKEAPLFHSCKTGAKEYTEELS